jgi:hypothetical protein
MAKKTAQVLAAARGLLIDGSPRRAAGECSPGMVYKECEIRAIIPGTQELLS